MPCPIIPREEYTFHRTLRWGDIYWYDFGLRNSTHTIQDWHPTLVLQNDIGNRFSPTTIITPLTSAENVRRMLPTHCLIQKSEHPELDNDSIVKLEQIFTIERDSLADQLFITRFRKATMRKIYEKLMISLNFGALR
jgi:mRNA interferase MazF